MTPIVLLKNMSGTQLTDIKPCVNKGIRVLLTTHFVHLYVGEFIVNFTLMDSSFWFDLLNLGQFIIHIQRCQVLLFPPNIVFFCLQIFFLPVQTVQTLIKCSIMLYFIWVFTVYKNTHLGVPQIQMVNAIITIKHSVSMP